MIRRPVAVPVIGSLIVVAARLLGTGCAPRAAVDPTVFEATVEAPASERLDSLATWLATGTIEADLAGKRGLGRLRILRLAPHRVRADIASSGAFGLFGTRNVLWIDEETIFWQEAGGPIVTLASDDFFSPALGRAAEVRDLEILLLGLAVLRDGWESSPVIERAGDRYTVSARLTGGVTEEAEIAGEPPALARLTRRGPDGRIVMVARFDRIREAGGLRVATRIEVRAPGSGDQLRIDWSRIEPNPDLRPADLAWPVVPGGTVREAPP